jgi:uncharacterized protein
LPRIGLLSDSHGRAETTRKAVERLVREGAQVLIHLGDVGTLEVIDELLVSAPPNPGDNPHTESGEPLEAHVVFGNVDWDADSMARYARSSGIAVDHPVGRLDCNGRQLVFLHGHDGAAMSRELAAEPAYLCHGHSHRTRDERVGKTRVINPGALFRASEYTVALLDTEADRLTFFPAE